MTPPGIVRSQPAPNYQPSSTSGIPGQPAQYGAPQGQNYDQDMSQPSTLGVGFLAEKSLNNSPQQQMFPPTGQTGAPQLPFPAASAPMYLQSSTPTSTSQNLNAYDDLPPLRPVFGVSLEDLLKRDGSAIPLIVYQCLQAVDLFGLDVEGIYRLSGSTSHVARLRAMFDNGERWHEILVPNRA